jgi:hypothetical protein
MTAPFDPCVAAVMALRVNSIALDGEVACLGADGVSDSKSVLPVFEEAAS